MATLADLNNTDAALDATATFETERARDMISAADAEATREFVQQATDPEAVIIEVRGEQVPCKPMGALKRAKLGRDALAADEAKDDLAALDSVLAIGDALEEHSVERYGWAFWSDLQDDELRDAFAALSEKSRGGNGRRR